MEHWQQKNIENNKKNSKLILEKLRKEEKERKRAKWKAFQADERFKV